MKIAIVSFKGGVGKTTTAIHLAAFLQTKAPALLLDGDGTRNAMAWSQRGELPFKTALADDAAELMPKYGHTVIDTGQRPEMEDLRAAYAVCDVIVIPSAPASLDTDGLGQTIRAMRAIGPDKFRVLLTKVARDAAKEAAEIRELLADLNAPILKAEIPALKAFTKAASAGQIVNQVKDPNAARAWDCYAAAAKELLL